MKNVPGCLWTHSPKANSEHVCARNVVHLQGLFLSSRLKVVKRDGTSQEAFSVLARFRLLMGRPSD